MKSDFKELVRLMEFMRSEKGCPWDREQNLKDFLVHLKNESDEVLDAIRREDYDNLEEELGDLLWNIVFISQMAKEQGKFDINDVIKDIRRKIVRRHPHVFGKAKAKTSEEVVKQYKKVKEKEKKRKLSAFNSPKC
ncbi:MAG: MazG nucleotide pyrophosphohydrolase domain-containing protein [Candidatus Altiarchaeota archaeon]